VSDLPYDCRECGACCVSSGRGGEGYVYLDRREAGRMRRLGLPVIPCEGGTKGRRGPSRLGTRPLPEVVGGGRVCVAFAGEIGGRCGCAVYPGRPTLCRYFEVGGFECRRARRWAGLPVWPRAPRPVLRPGEPGTCPERP
jgi:Fe-S-cluster containining protein